MESGWMDTALARWAALASASTIARRIDRPNDK
ncbi:hypothetical protein SPO2725 [Ruegeria pomeroyi DSS-3]|uniref:Uncharacterized protein n=1 Tax=Ruegeria pomeroyi (strain ATCC 700808 / DSM 15171 / DSS-3) TaxID=246200 RepID=Q5LPX1_RUEPO|nr:hypothetical protein SPO2725 [Ruegeria pomeroyi DSS-3]